ncbi:sodium/hydrogen exchanger 9B2-like isoform X2 [Cimex lectularius]|uniref:Cation/H+ exchanger transmembrane domain-containing protein n=1 Tax=Cimex lectularius TaxID=79782 RepID=A0A8I6RXU0_CIMLE|nr:sodium/hydrogen exchanger 9B2-like isoform X2 [Cimex lectularius]
MEPLNPQTMTHGSEGKNTRLAKIGSVYSLSAASSRYADLDDETEDRLKNITYHDSDSDLSGESCSLKFKNWIRKQAFLPNDFSVSATGDLLFVILTLLITMLFFNEKALPGGEIFHLLFLVVSCFFAGKFFAFIRLPPLLGQLWMGILLRTFDLIKTGSVYFFLITAVRQVSMAIILLKAGLGLELHSMLKLKWMIFKLTFFPCIGEATAAAFISHYALGFNWFWGFLMGFLLSSISPAVVIPPLLHLKAQGYGEDKGISTVVIAAAGLDDILSISCFSLFHSILFKPSANVYREILHGPIDLVLGSFTGAVWGLIAALFPHKEDDFVSIKRSAMISMGGICAVLASIHYNVDSAGPIFCMVSAFVASLCWKVQYHRLEEPIGSGQLNDNVAYFFRVIWVMIEPFLFGMIGAEIDVRALEPTKVAYSILIIVGALIFRVMICFLSLIGSDLNWKEMLFVNLAWLPKATVQAAIGPLPLDHLRARENTSNPPSADDLDKALLLLTTAVLSILITAPLGAVFIQFTGPCLLSKPKQPKEIKKKVQH